jgi:hypothetical protein
LNGSDGQGIVPVFLDLAKIDDVSDHEIEGAVVSVTVGNIEPAVGQIAKARRKPEPQQSPNTCSVAPPVSV